MPDPGGKLSDGRYEFNPLENMVIARAARLTRAWGIIAVVIGVLLAIMVIVGAALVLVFTSEVDDPTVGVLLPIVLIVALGPVALVNVITGWYYMASGRSLQEVVDTEGNDVAHLMSALDRVAGAFRIEVIFLVIAFALGVILQVASFVLNLANTAQGGTP